jgi:glutamine amidotransferase
MIACFSTDAVAMKYPLLEAPHALIRQSREDRVGKSHADGWGVACFHIHASPDIQKSVTPAYVDGLFGEAAARLQAPVWLAHVRAASTGSVTLENTHPFDFENWAWVHNGTIIKPLHLLSEIIMDNVAPKFRSLRHGTTDTELCFLLFLSELSRRAGADLNNPPVETAAAAMRAVVHLLSTICAPFKQNSPTMNFMASNGKILLAVRWGKPLSILQTARTNRLAEAGATEAVFVASEPFDDDEWQEVPERSLVIVDEAGSAKIVPLEN